VKIQKTPHRINKARHPALWVIEVLHDDSKLLPVV